MLQHSLTAKMAACEPLSYSRLFLIHCLSNLIGSGMHFRSVARIRDVLRGIRHYQSSFGGYRLILVRWENKYSVHGNQYHSLVIGSASLVYGRHSGGVSMNCIRCKAPKRDIYARENYSFGYLTGCSRSRASVFSIVGFLSHASVQRNRNSWAMPLASSSIASDPPENITPLAYIPRGCYNA